MSDKDAMLMAYVDGELDAEAAREVERLMEADPEARRAVEVFRDTAGLLRAACAEHVYAAGTKALLRPAAVPDRAIRRRGPMAAAALAACALGFAGGATWAGRPPDLREALVNEVASYHAVYAREDTPLDIAPAERADEIAAWIGQRLGRRLEVPDLEVDGLRFAGARLLVVEGRYVAQLMYARAQGLPVGLCIAKLGGEAPLRTERRGAQLTAAWQDDGYTYVLVGEMGQDELRGVAANAARQLGGDARG